MTLLTFGTLITSPKIATCIINEVTAATSATVDRLRCEQRGKKGRCPPQTVSFAYLGQKLFQFKLYKNN